MSALVAVSLLAALGLAELVARAVGFAPFGPPDVGIRVEPGGRYQRSHPTRGFEHLSGRYRITFPNGSSWSATHGEDGLRVTRPPAADAEPAGEREIWIFGCSFVHGWGLDDEQTFPWKLQARTPGFEVVNFGTGGYGTLQSMLQFDEAVNARPPPAVAVLAYASFHDERNASLRRWRKANVAYQRFGPTAQPYARLDGADALRIDVGGEYQAPLIGRLAFVHLLEETYNRFEDSWIDSREVTRRLLLLFAERAKRAGVEFVVVGVSRGDRTEEMLAFARQHGIRAGDISVDLDRPGFAIPWDGHPSALATDLFAERLYAILDGARLLGP